MALFYAVLLFSVICLVFTDNSRDSRLLLNDPNLLISQIQALESKIQQLTTAYHDQRRTIQALQSQVQTGNNGTCLTCIKYLCLKLWYFCKDISVYYMNMYIYDHSDIFVICNIFFCNLWQAGDLLNTIFDCTKLWLIMSLLCQGLFALSTVQNIPKV